MKKLRGLICLTTTLGVVSGFLPLITAQDVQAAQTVTTTTPYISTKQLSNSKVDVTGDGKADYVTVWNNGGKRNIATYVANGNGTFKELVNTVSSGSFTADVVGRDTGIFADVTGDGKADYIVPWNNNGKRSFATYVAKSDGTFNEYVNSSSEGSFITDTMGIDIGVFADVTGDGKADYIVTWNNNGKRTLTTYVAKGDGTFSTFVNTSSSGSFTADTVGRDTGIFTDVNGDGKTDYVVTWNNNGKRSFTTYLAKGDGTFSEFVNTASGGTFMLDTLGRDTGIFADVTGDGKADYIVPWNNNGKRSFATYVGKADGTFNELVSSSSVGTFKADSIGRDTGTFTDVTGDGKVDYIVSWNNGGKRSFATYVGKADGTFNELVSSSSAGTFTADSMGKDVGIFADVTGDGKADYVVPWNNNGKRSFATYVANANGTFNELVTTSSNGTFLADKIGRDLGGLVGDRDYSINDTSMFVVKTVTIVKTDAEILIDYAKQFLGLPYKTNGTTPDGFDCSGFVQYVYKNALNIDVSRTTYTQVGKGYDVGTDIAKLQLGDLVFFGDYEAPHHVGIYVGNGKCIHSPTEGQSIKYTNLSDFGDFSRARRIIG
ncbi:FG-GAP-like repeat-containing protein [Clostridium cellulovorans]|uniref:NLP/P60 protein n=1 Tax=Clostridium cellulovorans (strain ATCC 35296 / DSM 3052 / OCM 3 / 743B) TaxID=573061 RepID=D9SNQ9_CLOC7|nr:FG-GAP-like repeat-containing protein [Clostridium cellulovorans]ADL49930.1 NLP/P60 protein [Clostridium cellulovorans 743B]